MNNQESLIEDLIDKCRDLKATEKTQLDQGDYNGAQNALMKRRGIELAIEAIKLNCIRPTITRSSIESQYNEIRALLAQVEDKIKRVK